MRTILALPDYNQTGQINAIVDGKTLPLYQAVDMQSFPNSCEISGIPNPVLSRNKNQSFVFSQIARTKNYDYFLKSCRAGHDKSGRDVFLTCIFELEKNRLETIFDIDTLKAPNDQKDENIKKYIQILNQPSSACSGLPEMFQEYKKDRHSRHFSSASLEGMKYQADWAYGQKKTFPNQISPDFPWKKTILIGGVVIILVGGMYIVKKNQHQRVSEKISLNAQKN